MRTEIKTETVSERVRSEREQRAAEEREPGPSDGRRDPRFGVRDRLVNAVGRPFRRCGVELEVRRMLFGFLRKFID